MKNKLISLEELLERISSYDSSLDETLLRKAYSFSSDAHRDQKRHEGTSFIGHPLSVASILADMHLDNRAIIAGLLHDTVEDAEASINDIRDIFGKDIAFMVDALTKLDKMEFNTREEAQAENFRKMILAMSKDVRVIMIKFADRLHNMRTLKYLSPGKQRRIAAETLDIYAPLANRLGIGWLKVELEDLGFEYLYPEVYRELVKKVSKKRKDQEGYVKRVARIVQKKLQEQGLPGKVSGRVKHYYGIYEKMQRQRLTFEEVHDVLGLRIITDTTKNCYAILGLIHSLWIPVPGRFKDYIAMPKSNMYQSIHTTVLGLKGEHIEFQIRTEEMHHIDEEGIASHWIYKDNSKIKDKDAKYIKWLRDLVHSQTDTGDAREFLEMVKGEVFFDAVYVLTPAGEIKELPAGSTPVDFAYAVHTDLGNRCVGSRVNGRLVPLRYQLQNGDIVEIITSQNQRPSKDWLNFVVTQKARNRIKYQIKTEERSQGIELGSRILESELRKHGLGSSILKSEEMEKAIQSFHLHSLEDLLLAIGYGRISSQQVVNRVRHDEEPEEPTIFSKLVKTVVKTAKSQRGIRIKGMDNLLYHISKCCYPIPEDELLGYITIGKGVTIHRRECPNIHRLTVDDARLIDVTWKADDDTKTQTRLYVETIDKPGILAKLSVIISYFQINVTYLEARTTHDRHAHFTFMLDVRDKTQLMDLSQKLMSSEGVIRVNR